MDSTPPKRSRRKLPLSRRLLAGGSFLLGLLILISARANIMTRDGLTQVAGPIRHTEMKKYWEDAVLYVQLEGTDGRFKAESGSPGFDAFSAAAATGTPVQLWVDTTGLELQQPATIFHADVAGNILIRFAETTAIHNRETSYVMLLGPVFCFLGFWIWDRATRPLPTLEETAARTERIEKLAQKHRLLFAVVNIVDTIRRWGEELPKIGGLFTAFLFFWILPLYMVFIYVTAQSHRRIVAFFCCSYWIVLAALAIAAVALPDFPGAEEYPALGMTGSRLFNAYILLNICYGGVMWIWGTLNYESDLNIQPQPE